MLNIIYQASDLPAQIMTMNIFGPFVSFTLSRFYRETNSLRELEESQRMHVSE